MKLLKLTDGIHETGAEEYVEVDEISRIETRLVDKYEEVTVEKKVRKSLFSQPKLEKVTELVWKKKAPDGAIVYMKKKGKTFVKESPAQIVEMIKNKQYVEA